MNLVKVISTKIKNTQRLVQILRYGERDVQEPIQASPFGIDSNPIKDMIAVYGETGEKGKNVIIGYLNVNQLAEVGALRLFSTDEDGAQQTYLKLTNDGCIELGGNTDFMVRYSVLKEEYDKSKDVLDTILTILTGAPIKEPGLESPSVLQAVLSAALAGKSTGDISGCKIDEMKTL